MLANQQNHHVRSRARIILLTLDRLEGLLDKISNDENVPVEEKILFAMDCCKKICKLSDEIRTLHIILSQ